jgi:putative ABC transport system ATP-binding protein
MPLVFAGVPLKERAARAEEALARVGLTDRMNHLPTQLSGGEQQRVATARATINEPALVLADEPTGNLDSVTGAEIMRLIREMNRSMRRTFLIITHDREVASWADRVVHLKDGLVVAEEAKGGNA